MTHSIRYSIASALVIGLALAGAAPVAAQDMVPVQVLRNGQAGVRGLRGAQAVAVAPDGRHVYAASGRDNALTVYAREESGRLALVDSIESAQAQDGIRGISSLSVSPDGKHVYAASPHDHTVVVFRRSPDNEQLDLIQRIQDGDGVQGLVSPAAVLTTQDGGNVYVAAYVGDALFVFRRDSRTGRLRLSETLRTGVGGAQGLGAPIALAEGDEGRQLYVLSSHDASLAVFQREPSSGRLRFQQLLREGVDGVKGMGAARALVVTADGGSVYVVGAEGTLVAFQRDTTNGELSFQGNWLEGRGGMEGLAGAGSIAQSPDGGTIYIAGGGSAAVTAYRRDPHTGALNRASILRNGVARVSGLAGARALAVSPDGTNLYIAAARDDALSVFRVVGRTRLPRRTAMPGSDDERSPGIRADARSASRDEDQDDPLPVRRRNTTRSQQAPVPEPASDLDDESTLRPLTTPRRQALRPLQQDALDEDNESTLQPLTTPRRQALRPLQQDAPDEDNESTLQPLTTPRRQALRPLQQDALDEDNESTLQPLTTPRRQALRPLQQDAPDEDNESTLRPLTTPRRQPLRPLRQDAPDDIRDDAEPEEAPLPPRRRARAVASAVDDAPTSSLRTQLVPVQVLRNGQAGVRGLRGAQAVAVAPDGRHVYAASGRDNALTVYAREESGRLALVDSIESAQAQDGIRGISSLSVSPDGKHVYAASPHDHTVVVFRRSPDNEQLDLIQRIQDGDGVQGLVSPAAVLTTQDGGNVYVAAYVGDALFVFRRDSRTGRLRLSETLRTGVGGAQGLGAPIALAEGDEGRQLYVLSSHDASLAVFQREPSSGRLRFQQLLREGVDGVKGMGAARALVVTADGGSVYVVGAEGTLVAFQRDTTNGELSFQGNWLEGRGGMEGLAGAGSIAQSPDGGTIYIAGGGSAAVTAYRRDPHTGALNRASILRNGVARVSGLAGARALAVSPDGTNLYIAAARDDALSVFRVAAPARSASR